jgi:predicted aldo/keto reductase-like oxidoreductase
MKYRAMGSLPWEVSALGFGCMRLPTSGLLRKVNEPYATEIIRFGIDQGINYVDTAWLYHFGQSERLLGAALKGSYRQKVRLATKLPMILVRKEDDFEKYLDAQLERLQTNYLDFYLFHMLNQANFEKMKRLNLMQKMEKAREQGKIKYIGFSFHDTLPVFREIIDCYRWDMTQIQYNYMDTGIQATTDGLKYAHDKGIAVVIMEPLKGGQLVHPPAAVRSVMTQAPSKRSPVDWALHYLWNRPEVACVLSGMGNKRMVEENCASADRSGTGILTPEENQTLEKCAQVFRRKIIVPCTACQYCMPCPSGVDIPQNFALLNNKSFGSTGTFASRITQWLVSRNYRRLAGNRQQLAAKANKGRASLCTKCNACVPKCPQHIRIPDELEKVVAVFEKKKPVASFQSK